MAKQAAAAGIHTPAGLAGLSARLPTCEARKVMHLSWVDILRAYARGARGNVVSLSSTVSTFASERVRYVREPRKYTTMSAYVAAPSAAVARKARDPSPVERQNVHAADAASPLSDSSPSANPSLQQLRTEASIRDILLMNAVQLLQLLRDEVI